jgi:hypothetical protein
MDIREFFNSKKSKLIIEDDDNQDQNLLEAYKNSEFIPNNIIEKVLTTLMSSTEIIHTYSERHFIIKIKIGDLLNASITNWTYNRPPDMVRCSDIAKYIYLSKSPLDTMLYLNFNNKTKSFDVIDGIHRYTSLKIIKDSNSNSSLDFITPGDYGNNNDARWLYESYIILNMRFNSTEGELIELFKTLNKSTPIPDLYIRDVVKEKRDIIENLANKWQTKYKSHFSSNNKPNKPNINRDRFIDLLEQIYNKYNINENNKNLLEEVLERANWNISVNIPFKLSETIVKKCKESGCWLFIYTDDKILKIV